MYLIGLCGRSGSGKTLICSLLKKKGVYTIDADEVCRKLYIENADCIAELADRFGADIVTESGINRRLLAKRAYAENGGIEALNSISHKYITEFILKEADLAFKAGKRFVVVDAPTLFESGLNVKCDAVISVFSEKRTLYARLKQREGITRAGFAKRMGVQKSNRFIYENSDAVIKNNGSPADLRLRTLRAFLLVQIKLGVVRPGREIKRYVLKESV